MVRCRRPIATAAALGDWTRPILTSVGGLICWLLPGVCRADGVVLERRADWNDWSFDPVILINVCLVIWLYSRGRSWWRSRDQVRNLSARPTGIQRILSRPRAISFWVGMLLLVVTLLSPLDAMAGQLSSAHMVQHMLLMTVIAPLLILGAPGLVCFCGIPQFSRNLVTRSRRLLDRFGWRSLWNPWLVWMTYATTMWAWHLPWPYQAALRNQTVHDLQHASFLVAALLFWRVLLDPVSRQRLGQGQAVLFLFTTTLHATVLGVLMTISPRPWYPAYAGRTQWWGLTALEDQQLAGLIMWMPACVPYLVFAVVAFVRLVSEPSDFAARHPLTPVAGMGGGRS
jgi:putative membrane protein